MTNPDQETPPLSPWSTGLKARCPRCGTGRLYASSFGLTLRTRCDRCGLDYEFIDTGDGPAVFAIMILGFVILGASLLVEFTFHPPIWLHVLIWTPLTLLLALGLLRPLKALLIAMQYVHKAEEGRRADQ